MANNYFRFKQFTVHQENCAMKVTTDACLFGAWVANSMKNRKVCGNALDIGAGTGLLSLMVAQENRIPVDAVEIDPAAAEQACQNFIASGFEGLAVLQNDILKMDTSKYGVIFCNPPFYETDLTSPDLRRSAAHHGRALRWKDLFAFIYDRLEENGCFYLLLPATRKAEADELFEAAQLYPDSVVAVRQSPDHPVFRMMIRGGKNGLPATLKELFIKDHNSNYTADFITLLQPYYLYL